MEARQQPHTENQLLTVKELSKRFCEHLTEKPK